MHLSRKLLYKLVGATAAVIVTRNNENAHIGASIGDAIHDWIHGKPANENLRPEDQPYDPNYPDAA